MGSGHPTRAQQGFAAAIVHSLCWPVMHFENDFELCCSVGDELGRHCWTSGLAEIEALRLAAVPTLGRTELLLEFNRL